MSPPGACYFVQPAVVEDISTPLKQPGLSYPREYQDPEVQSSLPSFVGKMSFLSARDDNQAICQKIRPDLPRAEEHDFSP